MLEHNHGYAL